MFKKIEKLMTIAAPLAIVALLVTGHYAVAAVLAATWALPLK